MAQTKIGSGFITSGAISSTDLANNSVTVSKISATGTPSSSTFLRGDGAWAASGLSWQAVQTTGFTAVAGRAYPCNTTSAAFTVTLPATPSVGDTVLVLDYAGTAATNNISVNPNGNKIQGSGANAIISVARQSLLLAYVDATQGWLSYAQQYAATNQSYSVQYVVIAGGGASGANAGSGGGAGGYRSSVTGESSGGGASAESALTVTSGTSYTVTVGAGGASSGRSAGSYSSGVSGSNSVFGSITSVGGGYGQVGGATQDYPASGGSGGGVSNYNGIGGTTGAAGTSGQGYKGGDAVNQGTVFNAAGGGGAGGAGGNASGGVGGVGGAGVTSAINNTSTVRASGGSGYLQNTATPGGGGAHNSAGTANTGGGGGSGPSAGGSGIVILRYASPSQIGTGGTVTSYTSGGTTYQVHTFTSSGTFTA